jgi:hypothetical protein
MRFTGFMLYDRTRMQDASFTGACISPVIDDADDARSLGLVANLAIDSSHNSAIDIGVTNTDMRRAQVIGNLTTSGVDRPAFPLQT